MMNNPQKNLLDEIRFAAQNGFDYLDLTVESPAADLDSTNWTGVRQALQEANLAVICHAAPYLPLNNPSPRVRQAALDDLKRSLDVAVMVGAKAISTHYLGFPGWMPETTAYEMYASVLRPLCEHGATQGVYVAIENGSRNTDQLKRLREILLRLPDLRLLLDMGHANVNVPRNLLREYLFDNILRPRLIHLHASDNDGNSDGHLPLGAPPQGGINWSQVVNYLRTFNYDGTLTFEVFSHDRRWLLASRDYFKSLWDARS